MVAVAGVALAAVVVVFHSQLLSWRAANVIPHAGAATGALWIATFACLSYLGLVFAIDFVFLFVAVVENRLRVKESNAEDTQTIAESRFTIPVSVIAPMRDEEVLAGHVVEALLDLDYPEFEIIVVDDG